MYKLFDQCLAENKSRGSWSATQSFNIVDAFSIKGTTATGNVLVELSPSAIDAFVQAVAIAAPVIKAKSYERQSKDITLQLERLDQDTREVKNKMLQDLRDPNAARLAAIKAGPSNWQ